MLIRSRTTLCSVAVLLAISACTGKDADKKATADATAKDKTEAVLTVNGTVVSQRELDMLMRMQPAQREAPAARKNTLDNLTLQILAAQEATKKGFDKLPEVSDQMEMSKTSILAQSFVKDFFEHDKPTDAQLAAEYDKLKAEAAGNQYHAHHILVKTEDEAKAIIVKLNKDPSSFGDLAKAQSLDPVSKAKGGDLGWFDTKNMVPEFGDAVSKLTKGKITQVPVKTQYGYHVIELDDTRPMADSVPPLEQIKPALAQHIQQEDLKKALDALKAQAKIDVKS
jgi:peptidyl-prolyl cis-trans isomerase C